MRVDADLWAVLHSTERLHEWSVVERSGWQSYLDVTLGDIEAHTHCFRGDPGVGSSLGE